MNSTQVRDLWSERVDQMRAREWQVGDAFSFAESTPRERGVDAGPSRRQSPGALVLARRRRRRILTWCACASVPLLTVAFALQHFLIR